MADLLFLVVTVMFFAVAAGFVSVCDRIIGPDSEHGDPHGTGEVDVVDPQPQSSPAVEADLAGSGGFR